MTSSALSEPQRYLEAQIRWRPVEIAFWLATLLPCPSGMPPISASAPIPQV
jgi:hypothetical protein